MTTSVFYNRFERHSHAQGLKAHSTHYCPGCGHGLAHKFMAEAIDELGIQDRTIAVSPVGCAVFLYYYFDVGNTQAAHGRAPAVALGHKLANPESIVVTYQGDGDLASIGIAEIMQAAQLGLPLTVIFVNNAIYGMTGGQLAPTTLMGQRTSTSPDGRNRNMGEPLKMAEIIALMDGPIYVERVALFDARERTRAKKAILKGFRNQVEKRGFSFVEVLAECPTHLKMTPEETEKWVKTEMTKVFPLGLKKDVSPDPWFEPKAPSFDAEKILSVVGATTEPAPRFAKGFATQVDRDDISLKLAGSGGDGAQTAALLLTIAAINEGFDATHIPSYGPESRGGTSYADVHVAREEVLNPASPAPHALLAFNAPSLAKFGPAVRPGGVAIYDSTIITAPPALPGIQLIGVPLTGIATELGKPVVKNIAALGALEAATGLLPSEAILHAVREALGGKKALIPVNEEAFARGARAAREAVAAVPVA